VKDIVRQLYSNFMRIASARGSARTSLMRELFPPMGLLTPSQISQLEKNLGIEINNAALFEQALTHRSYLQVLNSPDHRSNERLEFLGDSILGMVTAEYLFYNHKEVLEGELTKMRSWLVNKNSLAICARNLHLDEFLFLSYSARQSLARGNDGMLADALESVIAAIFLDSGFEHVRNFIVHSMLPIMVKESLVKDTNYKSLLLEDVQARGFPAPKYVVVQEEGPDHEKHFTVEVHVDGRVIGTGRGRNKKEAEQEAAQEGIEVFTRRKRKQ
jgi:ribonuclease-3